MLNEHDLRDWLEDNDPYKRYIPECECYKIGGPFISVDPDCEEHNEDNNESV